MTTKQTHTPGPWTFQESNNITAGDGFPVASVNFPRHEDYLDECRANAALIAAAPDLLAALKTILTITAQNSGPGLDAIELLAAHVVAKAEGGR